MRKYVIFLAIFMAGSVKIDLFGAHLLKKEVCNDTGADSKPCDWKSGRYSLVMKNLLDNLKIHYPDIDNFFMVDSQEDKDDQNDDFSRFRNHLLNAVKALKGNVHHGFEKSRYLFFIKEYRDVISSDYYQSNRINYDQCKYIKLVQDIAYYYYTKNRIHNYNHYLYEQILDQKSHSAEGYLKVEVRKIRQLDMVRARIKTIQKIIHRMPEIFDHLANHKKPFQERLVARIADTFKSSFFWSSYDPAVLGNLPWLKFAFSRKGIPSRIDYVRMPTPTVFSDQRTRIVAEFEAYVDSLRARKKRHLYINFQDLVNPGIFRLRNSRRIGQYVGIENESYRSKLIQNMENKGSYRDVIEVLTLSKDSGFYWQSGRSLKNDMQALEFMDLFLDRIFDGEEHGYEVPVSWRQSESRYRFQVAKIMRFVHEIFFDSRTVLNKEERMIFIEIAYGFISDLASIGFDSVNQTCKSGIDRAGGANAMTFLLVLVAMAADLNTTDDEFSYAVSLLPSLMFGDALQSKMREIRKVRLDRFHAAALRIADSFIEDPTRVAAACKRISLTGILYPSVPRSRS